MKRLVSSFTFFIALGILMAPGFADAAVKPNTASKPVGYDISYPQCGKKLPGSAAFVVIGVNGGTAANTNPCLAEQLAWAKKATKRSKTNEPKIQLYINTANPGEKAREIATWPTNNTDEMGFDTSTHNPYGQCRGANDMACSWQYGWNRAVEAVLDRFMPAAQKADTSKTAKEYTWWLDVETVNTWQAGSPGALARNTASLEGAAAYLRSLEAAVGLYSTAVQWGEITGNTNSTALQGLPNWRPSGSTLVNAVINCSASPLTQGGTVTFTQYVQDGIDKNYSCR